MKRFSKMESAYLVPIIVHPMVIRILSKSLLDSRDGAWDISFREGSNFDHPFHKRPQTNRTGVRIEGVIVE